MVNGDKIVKALQQKAYTKGKDLSSVFTEMLDTFVDFLSYERLQKFQGETDKVVESFKDNEWFEIFTMWLDWVNKRQRDGKVVDAFDFYEGAVKSKGKADALGQFYTPQCLCDMMGQMVSSDFNSDKDVLIVNDCAVGSGRTLLGFANAMSTKRQPNVCYYIGGDIDAQSVKMCAINLAINGLLGRVLHADALKMSVWGGYEINESKYPFWSDSVCIRKLATPSNDTPQTYNLYNTVDADRMKFLTVLYQCRIGNPDPCIELIPEDFTIAEKTFAEVKSRVLAKSMAKYFVQPKERIEQSLAVEVTKDSKNWVQLSLFD